MAKTDNLTDFLTDIADAIREKKGITGTINPQDFSSEIASIESGGGSGGGSITPASVSDVNFYDYDGTILYSYTKEQFLALSAMPELPTREGLICQGWNWTLNDAKEYVTDYGMLNIGTMYVTDDGDTRLYIRIATEGRMTVPLYWNQSVANGVGIDWGDGSDIQTFTGTGNLNTTHTYAKCGDYVIRLKVVNNCTLGLGSNSSSYCVMGVTNNTSKVYCNMLQKVEIGARVTSIGTYAFKGCYSLSSVSIPQGVTSIGDRAFNGCYSLSSVSIPSSVTSIGNSAFSSCDGMAIYDFTKHTSVPTLSNTNAFSSIPSDCVIKVPSSLLSTWKSATNWSKYANKIVGV